MSLRAGSGAGSVSAGPWASPSHHPRRRNTGGDPPWLRTTGKGHIIILGVSATPSSPSSSSFSPARDLASSDPPPSEGIVNLAADRDPEGSSPFGSPSGSVLPRDLGTLPSSPNLLLSNSAATTGSASPFTRARSSSYADGVPRPLPRRLPGPPRRAAAAAGAASLAAPAWLDTPPAAAEDSAHISFGGRFPRPPARPPAGAGPPRIPTPPTSSSAEASSAQQLGGESLLPARAGAAARNPSPPPGFDPLRLAEAAGPSGGGSSASSSVQASGPAWWPAWLPPLHAQEDAAIFALVRGRGGVLPASPLRPFVLSIRCTVSIMALPKIFFLLAFCTL